MATDFASLALAPSLIAVLEQLGYAAPTPIQAQSIPLLLAGKDLIGQSKTGSGKTAAFALPILQNLKLGSRSLQALVVCPTRELSAQVTRELRKLGRGHDGLVVLTVTGGEPFARQADSLARGVHIVVATPGRLLDHLRRGTLASDGVTTVVLDEADRMLDMGFVADVEQILSALPAQRQTALFSATFPAAIEALSRGHQRDAVRLTIDAGEQPVEIRQLALFTQPDQRLYHLCWLLSTFAHESALIFCNYKTSVADVQTALASFGASVDSLHGDLEQFERDQVLARFRSHSLRLLIATDVAGRGLDVEDLDLVINYELPFQTETYVHRVGRTGRAGKQGLAISLYNAREASKIEDIEATIGRDIEQLEVANAQGATTAQLAAQFARPARMDAILISGGRKNKMRPGDILGALTGEAGGLDGGEVGKIEIRDRLSYVAVSRHKSQQAVRSLNKGRIKGKRFRATLVGAGRDRRRSS